MVTRSLSIEDGNLNTPSIITGRRSNYVDIDLTFTAKGSGDIYKKTDAGAVKQAVKNLLLTSFGEKPFKPYFGGNLGGLLFELMDDDTADEITDEIKLAINNYEPRAKVLDVKVRASIDNNSLEVTVVFQIVSTDETITFTTSLAKVR